MRIDEHSGTRRLLQPIPPVQSEDEAGHVLLLRSGVVVQGAIRRFVKVLTVVAREAEAVPASTRVMVHAEHEDGRGLLPVHVDERLHSCAESFGWSAASGRFVPGVRPEEHAHCRLRPRRPTAHEMVRDVDEVLHTRAIPAHGNDQRFHAMLLVRFQRSNAERRVRGGGVLESAQAHALTRHRARLPRDSNPAQIRQ